MKPSKIENAKNKVTNTAKTVGATAVIAAIPAAAIGSTFLYPKSGDGKPKVADTAKGPATANNNDFQLVQSDLGSFPEPKSKSPDNTAPTPLIPVDNIKVAAPVPGLNRADRSPGTPGPEESSVPVPTGAEPNEPVLEGKSNGVPEAPVPGSAESTKVIVSAQPPKLAFTGPMEITVNPFSNDQSAPAQPAVVAGQGGPVNPDIHTPHLSPQPLPFPPVNPN